MSSGTITVNFSPSYYFYKTWGGADGRAAWNNYSSNATLRKSTAGDPSYINLDPDPAYRATLSANEEIALVNQLSEAVQGHQLNLGVALGERKQTIDLVVNTVGKFVKVIRSLKKGRFDLALRHFGSSPARHKKLYPARKMRSDPKSLNSKDISAQWLELQYGWKPLLNDVYESARAYESFTKKTPSYTQRVRKTKSRSQNYVAGKAPFLGNGYAVGRQDSVLRVQIIVRYATPPSVVHSLGLTDPLTVAWELIPFSFVADWFIPIGPYLEAVNAFPQNMSVTFCKSVHLVDRVMGVGVATPYKGSSFSTRIMSFQRTVSSSYYVPKPTLKALDKAFSADHVKNAVALLHQLLL